jgi:hypothetical protein
MVLADRKRKRSKKEKLSPSKPKNSLDQFFSRGLAERKPLTEKKNEKVYLNLNMSNQNIGGNTNIGYQP